MATQHTEDNKGTMAETNKVPIMNAEENNPEAKTLEVETPEVKDKDTLSTESDDESSEESEFKLTRDAIENLGKAVHLVDSDEDNGLDLFCYVKCTNTDSDLLKRCRGIIFHGKDLVLQAFPYTAEFNHEELARLEEVLCNFGQFRFYDAHEGALLRMFHFNGKWYLSTHRKLNAFRSKWSSRDSFGTNFKKALSAEIETNKKLRGSIPDGDNILERFYTILDPNKQYMFLVLNGEDNRIVCAAPDRPKMYHVGTFVNGELDLDDEFVIPKPTSHRWLNIDEMINYVENIDTTRLQGVICFGPNNTQLKIFHKDYQEYFRVRGNEASIKYRYLQIRMHRNFVTKLYELYPDKKDIFLEYENTLFDVARMIHRSYVQRFIKRNYVTLPKEEFQVMKECHEWHLDNRTENRISLEKVISVLNKQSPTALNHMIRRFRTEQAKKKEQQNDMCLPRSYTGSRNNSPALVPSSGSPVESPLLLGKTGNLPPPPRF